MSTAARRRLMRGAWLRFAARAERGAMNKGLTRRHRLPPPGAGPARGHLGVAKGQQHPQLDRRHLWTRRDAVGRGHVHARLDVLGGVPCVAGSLISIKQLETGEDMN